MSRSSSAVVDSRVVELQLDNTNFEKNATTTISTVQKLQQALNFTVNKNGFKDVSADVKKITVKPLTEEVNALKKSMDNLADTVGFAAVVRYTNKALDAVERLVKAMTIDQVSAGWEKYADKTQAVGTLIAQGYDLDTVNEQLERLNWFTDETSYNFTEMVSNIAKFTATGQGLETSVTAMEGIATWAALSGQNAATASRAMYQLSQAMGAGVMRKEDYKSIQNVSMDTDEFRQHALDAAVALGTLKKNADDTYQSLVADTKAGAEAFNKSQFAESLTQGQWFTKDVMMKVFNEYSAAVDQIYEYAEERGITASEAMEEAGEQFDAFGLKAFMAAQEARSWIDVVDSIKDAMSTGFMNTFELIFGNYEQATALWTGMANYLYDVVVEPLNSFNEILEGAFSTGEKIINLDDWNKLGLTEAQATGLAKALKGVGEAAGITFKDDSLGSFLETLSQDWLTADKLKETLEGFDDSAVDGTVQSLEELQDVAMRVIRGDYGNGLERIQKLTEEGYDAEQVQSYVNELWKLAGRTWNITDAIKEQAAENLNLTESIAAKSDEELIALGYTQEEIDQLRELQKIAEETGKPLSELFESEENMTGRERLLNNLRVGLEAVERVAGAVHDAFYDIFDPLTSGTISKAISKIGEVTNAFNEFTKKHEKDIRKAFDGIFSVVDLAIRVVTTFASTTLRLLGKAIDKLGLVKFLGKVGSTIKKVRDWIVEHQVIEKIFDKLEKAITKAAKAVSDWFDKFKQIPQVKAVIDSFNETFKWIGDNFGTILLGAGAKLKLFKDSIKDAFRNSKDPVEFFSKVKDAFSVLWSDLTSSETFTRIKASFAQIGTSIKEYFNELGNSDNGSRNAFGKIIDALLSFRRRVLQIFSGLDENGEKIDLFKGIKQAFSDLWLGISTSGIAEKITGVFDKIKMTIDGFFTALGSNENGELNLFGKVWNGVKTAFSVIGSKIDVAKDAVHKFFEEHQLGSSFLEVISNISEGVTNFFTNLPAFFAEAKVRFGDFIERVNKTGGFALNNLGNVWTAFKDTILDFFKTSDLFSPLVDGFTEAWGTITETVYNLGSNGDGSRNLWGKFTDLEGNFLDAIWNTLTTLKQGFVDFFKSLPDFFMGLVPKFDEFFGKVRELGGIKFDNISDIFQAFKDTIGQYFKDSNLFDPIGDAFELIKNDLKERFEDGSIIDPILEAFDTVKEEIKSRLEAAGISIDGLGEKFQNFIDTIQQAWSDFKDEGPLGALLKLFTGDTVNAAEIGEKLAESSTGFGTFFGVIKSIDPNVIFKIVGALIAFKSLGGIVESIKNVSDSITSFFNGMNSVNSAQAGDITRQGRANAWLKIAGSIALIAFAIYKVGSLDISAIQQGAIVVGAIAAAFLVFNWLADKLVGATDMKSIGEGLAGFAKAISTIALVVVAVNVVPWDVLGEGLKKVAVIGGLLLVATLALGLIGRVGGKNGLDAVNALDKFVTIVEKVATLVTVLSVVSWGVLKDGLTKMAAVMGALLVPLFAIAIAGRIAGGKTVASLGAITLVIGAIAGILYLLGEYGDVDKYSTIADSIAKVMLSVAGVIAVLGGLPMSAGPKAAVSLLGFIGILTAVGGALAAIEHFTGVDVSGGIAAAADMMGKLGEVLGKLIGGVFKGALEKIGEVPEEDFDKLVDFITKIAELDIPVQSEFKWDSEGLRWVDQSLTSFADGMKGIATAVNMLEVPGNAEDLNRKGEYFEQIGNFVDRLANITIPVQEEFTWNDEGIRYVDQSLKSFADGMDGITGAVNKLETPGTPEELARKGEYFTKIGEYVTQLAAVDIPVQSEFQWTEDGIRWTDQSLSTFSAGMKGITDAVNKLETPGTPEDLSLKGEYFTKIGNYVTQLAGVTIPVQTDFQWTKEGIHDTDQSLNSFAIGMKGITTAVNNLETPGNTEALNRKAQYFEDIGNFTERLANITIPVQTDFQWTRFGIHYVDTSLKSFAKGMQGVVDAVNGVEFNFFDVLLLSSKKMYFDMIADFTRDLAAIEIPEQTSLKEHGWFTADFVDSSLKTFAEGMAGVVGAVNGLNLDLFGVLTLPMKGTYFSMVADFVSKLAAIPIPEQMHNITDWNPFFGTSETSDSSLLTFAAGMAAVGSALNEMDKPKVTVEDVQTMADCVAAMASAAANIPPQKKGFSAWLSGDTSLSNFATEMLNAADPIVQASQAAAGLDKSAIEDLAGSIEPMTTAISTILASANGNDSFFSDNLSVLADYAARVTEIGESFSTLSGIKDVHAEDIQRLPEIMEALKKVSQEGLQSWEEFAGEDGDPFGNLGEYLAELSYVGSQLEIDNLTTISDALSKLQGISFNTGDLADATIITQVSDNVGTLKTMIEGLSGIDTSGVYKFTSSLEKINSAKLQGAAAKIAESQDTKNSGAETGKQMSDSIAKGIDSSAISSAASSAVSSALQGIDVSGGMSVGAKLAGQIAAGISKGSSTIKTVVGTVVKAASDKADAYKSDFGYAGMHMVTGLANGIRNNRSTAINAAADVAAAALAAAKERLDISSPSKEMAEVGKFFDLGFAKGINEFTGRVYDESASVASGAMEALKASLSDVNDILSGETLNQPVITPVLDLTEVQNGASMMGSLFDTSPTIVGNFSAIGENADAMRQRADTTDILTALQALGSNLGTRSGDTYNINGITYDDGSNVSNTVRELIRAVKVERRA